MTSHERAKQLLIELTPQNKGIEFPDRVKLELLTAAIRGAVSVTIEDAAKIAKELQPWYLAIDSAIRTRLQEKL